MGNAQSEDTGFLQNSREPLLSALERLHSNEFSLASKAAPSFTPSRSGTSIMSGWWTQSPSEPESWFAKLPRGKSSLVYRGRLPRALLTDGLSACEEEGGEVFDSETVEVAIRRILLGEENGGKKEYWNEVNALVKVGSHPHIVSLLGFCSEGGQGVLAYEYIPNGDLSQALFFEDSLAKLLPLSARIQIAIDIASGLSFFHENNIIHCDLRPSNVLLDISFRAKLKGLKHAVQSVDGKLYLNQQNRITGRIGYICPSHIETGMVSTKTDVYSFGVIILQLLSGRIHFRSIESRDVVTVVSMIERPELSVAIFESGIPLDETALKVAAGLKEKAEVMKAEKELARQRRDLISTKPNSVNEVFGPSENPSPKKSMNRNGYVNLRGKGSESRKESESEDNLELLFSRDCVAEKVNTFEEFLDPRMEVDLHLNAAKRMALIGLQCVQDVIALRPSAKQISDNLHSLLEPLL